MKTRTVLWAVTGALLLAGCGSDDSGDASGSDEPTSTTSATATPTGPIDLTGKGSRPAGTYRVNETRVPFEITLNGEGWWAGEAQEEFMAFNLYPSDWTAYVTVFFPTEVFDGTDTNSDPLPKDMVRWLRNRPGLKVTKAIETEIDGHPAVTWEAELVDGIHECSDGEGGTVDCLLVAPIPLNEDYRAFEDEKSRVWVVDIDGPVLIAVSQVNERFDGFVDRGTEVVESIDFLD